MHINLSTITIDGEHYDVTGVDTSTNHITTDPLLPQYLLVKLEKDKSISYELAVSPTLTGQVAQRLPLIYFTFKEMNKDV